MIINKETKIKDLLEAYPFLKDELIKRFPKFKLLNSKLAAKLTENANIEKVAQKANVEPEKLINKIQKLIEENNTK